MRNMSGAAPWWNPSANSRAGTSEVAGRLSIVLKTTARHSRNQMQRTGCNRDNGESLFPPLAPVQLSLSRGRDALNSVLAQRAGLGANPRGKTRFLASVVQRGCRTTLHPPNSGNPPQVTGSEAEVDSRRRRAGHVLF
jgi:hypothetical protein